MPTRILSIDDDPSMTELLGLLLKTFGFEVLTTNSGRDGLSLIKTKNPDIVLLDLMMPGLDGWEVCKQIRTSSDVPVLVLSALDNPNYIANALDAGADDFLVKPTPAKVLVATINKMVRRANGMNGTLYTPHHSLSRRAADVLHA